MKSAEPSSAECRVEFGRKLFQVFIVHRDGWGACFLPLSILILADDNCTREQVVKSPLLGIE